MDDGGFLRESESSNNCGGPARTFEDALAARPCAAPSSRYNDGARPTHEAVSLGSARNGCQGCDCLTFNNDWLIAFGVALCNNCRSREQLISKKTARARYMLSDADLASLGSIRKANPNHKDWQPMHLYLQSQVEEVAQKKHGELDMIAEKQAAAYAARAAQSAKRKHRETSESQHRKARLLELKEQVKQSLELRPSILEASEDAEEI